MLHFAMLNLDSISVQLQCYQLVKSSGWRNIFPRTVQRSISTSETLANQGLQSAFVIGTVQWPALAPLPR
jgi:hypothetical protein